MKGIALIRVSTESQDLKQQSDAVINEMIRDGYIKEDIILIEDKESGVLLSEEERQGLNKMKSYIEENDDINAVYVYELSRLSRKPEVLYSIRNYLEEHKIQLVVIKPSIRLFDDGKISESANMMFAIFGAMAEQEGYIRKERTKRGRRRCIAEGKYVGGFLPLGYKADANHMIVINESEAILVRKIFNRYAEGDVSLKMLAEELIQTGELKYTNYQNARSRLREILTTETYTGAPSKRELHIKYPPIIEKELFDKVQSILQQHKKAPKFSTKCTVLLKGIIRDGLTKRCLVSNTSIAMYHLFMEYTDGKRFESAVNLNVVDSIAWHLTMNYQSMNNSLLSKQLRENSRSNIKTLTSKIETARKKIEGLKEKEIRIQNRIVDGKMAESIGDRMLQSVYEEIETLKIDINKWDIEKINLISYVQMTEFVDDEGMKANLSSITNLEEKKRLIRESIKSFDVWRIMANKMYYQGTVTFVNGSSVSFVFNAYTKVARYLDGEKMVYEYKRTIPKERMKYVHYERKTQNPTRGYSKPQPDSFFP